jgi:hypothetical protein
MGKRPVIGLNMSLAAVRDEDRWELQASLAYVDAVAGAYVIPISYQDSINPVGWVRRVFAVTYQHSARYASLTHHTGTYNSGHHECKME